MTCRHCGNPEATLIEVTDQGDVYCAVCARVTVVRGAAARLPRRVAAVGGEVRVGRPAAGSHTGAESPPTMRKICGVFVTLGLLLLPALVHAQTMVFNPTTVEFFKSTDHDVTLPDGQTMVTSYEFRVYAVGASAPVSRVSLGKPAPDATGKCSAGITATIVSLPLSPTLQYVAKVAAIGPAGEGESPASNPFLRVGAPGAPASVVLK